MAGMEVGSHCLDLPCGRGRLKSVVDRRDCEQASESTIRNGDAPLIIHISALVC